MSLVRTVCAKGDELGGKLIRLMSTLALIFLPKMEMAVWGTGGHEGSELGEFSFLSKLRQTDLICGSDKNKVASSN